MGITLAGRTWRAVGAAALPLAVMAACTNGNDSSDPVDAAAEPVEQNTPPTPIPMPDACTPTTPEDIQAIETALAGTGNRLTDAFTVTDANGNRLIMANLDRADGQRLTSANIWAITPDGQTHAITSGAQDQSLLPANSIGLDTSGTQPLIDCLTASAQARNLGT